MALSDNHHQRIHPVAVAVADVERPPPPPPLPPPSAPPPEKKSNHQINHPQRIIPPPPPVIYPDPPLITPNKKTKSPLSLCLCGRCLCWTICIILLLIILIGATIAVLFLIFNPKIPTYSINSLSITDLRLNFDMSLYAKFHVKITAYNPNEKIGIYYQNGGALSVWYTNNNLCEGSLPVFYHGHRNRTVLDVDLTGRTVYGSTLMAALMEQQQTGRIPLNLRVVAPVAVKLGKMKLRRVEILGNCLLVVDRLTANNAITIKASDCKFKLKL